MKKNQESEENTNVFKIERRNNKLLLYNKNDFFS